MAPKVEKLTTREQRVLALMSEGAREIDICLKLGMTQSAFQKAQKHIEERAKVETHDAGRYYERALRLYAEAEKSSVEARFHALMDASPMGVLVVDGRTGLIREANHAASKLFGFEAGELLGVKVEELVPKEQQQIHNAYRIGFLASVRKRQMGYHPPIFALCKDGSTIEIAIALTATPSSDDVMVVCTEFEKWTVAERDRVNGIEAPSA